MDYDYIITCGGGGPRVPCWPIASLLAARTRPCWLEAGQDTPHGKVPAAVLDSYPGTAYLNPNFTWNQLKVTTEVISHNNPQAPRPPLRTAEQARILGGGSPINGQLPPIAARRPTTMNGTPGVRPAGTGTTCCRISKRSSRTWISTVRGTDGMAAFRCAAFSPTCGPSTRNPWLKHSNRPAGNTSSIRTRNGRTAISRSPFPTPTSVASPPRSVISIPERGCGQSDDLHRNPGREPDVLTAIDALASRHW